MPPSELSTVRISSPIEAPNDQTLHMGIPHHLPDIHQGLWSLVLALINNTFKHNSSFDNVAVINASEYDDLTTYTMHCFCSVSIGVVQFRKGSTNTSMLNIQLSVTRLHVWAYAWHVNVVNVLSASNVIVDLKWGVRANTNVTIIMRSFQVKFICSYWSDQRVSFDAQLSSITNISAKRLYVNLLCVNVSSSLPCHEMYYIL